MIKLTDRQKARRKANRDRYWNLHIRMTMEADKAGYSGLHMTCRSYREAAQKAYEEYKKNGGRN